MISSRCNSKENSKTVICFITMTHGDWGGASRVLFTNLRMMAKDYIQPLILLPRDGPIIPELIKLGFRYKIWGPLHEPGGIFRYIEALVRSIRFFRRENVKLIHINSTNLWRPAELLAARILRIPIIAHYHVVNSDPSPAMGLCSAAICVSQYTAEHSLPTDLTKSVIYNPVEIDRFDHGKSLRDRFGLSEEHVVISFLGQVREIKGVQDFIAMARKVDSPYARFLIAGECRDPIKYPGSYSEQDLETMSEGDDRIRYIGYIKAVEDVYHSSDIIVIPSRWQEPLGLINLEAGACRKPVVATSVGGIPEIVKDGINGYLVEPGDIDAMAERVKKLIDSSELRTRMGAEGRKLIEEAFVTTPVGQFERLLLSYARKT